MGFHAIRRPSYLKKMNRFESGAAELRRLHEKIKLHSAGASHEFADSYDALAFPGGLSTELRLLEEGNARAVEMAVQFLEANPWYLRSGYHKEAILKTARQTMSK